MALMTFVAPILPGKTEQWRRFTDELKGPRFREFTESRRRVGLHERTFLQSTPQGDFVIVTLEGDDPLRSFQQLINSNDDFSRWFLQQASEVHGFDLSKGFGEAMMAQLVVDTRAGGLSQR